MTDQLHPRHPGRGSSTSLIAAEGRTVEEGGFFIFFPSGLTKSIGWRSASPINPVFDAAKQYSTQVLEELLKAGHEHDASSTNWVSVIAAAQKIIMDWNDNLRAAIGRKMRSDIEDAERRERERREDASSATVFTFPAYHEAPAPSPAPPPDTSFDSGGGGDFSGGGSSGDY